jgi:hypothetical protein
VLLSSNVFVAAHRAIALGLAAAASVFVRSSRREPHFARALAEVAPGLFEVVLELSPRSGDTFWAYGEDETLSSLRERLPGGVRLIARGAGFGAAVVHEAFATRDAARALVADIVPFDQRGCLSPRVALLVGDVGAAQRFAELVAEELDVLARSVPLGRLDQDELAAVARYRDTMIYGGTLIEAGPGVVGIGPADQPTPAPVGRNLSVVPASAPVPVLRSVGRELTALGVAGDEHAEAPLRAAFPGARVSLLCRMQRPRFDGPADRRA